jgi:hypothetical protein
MHPDVGFGVFRLVVLGRDGIISTRSQAMSGDDRPVPFVLRVATQWRDLKDVPDFAQDAVLIYRERALLTGCLSSTANGGDVTFSDLGFSHDSDRVEPTG